MSSGGWELVGKNKKDKSGGKAAKLTKAEKKKFIENAPKVEDFLPLSQVKTLYDNLDGNKENKKPAKEKEHKTKENEEKKKQQKLQQQQQAEKKKQEPKGKPPKTIKDALNMIDSMEFSNILIDVQTRYPGAPLIWLKDLSAFLNAKIPLDKEDSVFSGKPKNYPLSLVPAGILCTLEKAIDMAGQQNAQLFYEITFTAMTTDMAKGVPVIGHKIFLQLLARSNPEMTVASIPKLISLRNSYQNRKPIGLSLLWALSQGGDKNLAVGLKIWHEIMSSLLSNKTYASYVVQILNDLVFGHENSCDLNPELYFNIIEDSYSGKSNVPVHLGGELHLSIEKLRSILFKNKDINYSKLFEILLGKINQKINSNYRDELIKALADCLVTEPRCFNIWESVYSKNLYQSNLLLIYLNTHWNNLRSMLRSAVVKETLLAFQMTNERWKKGKEENLVHSCNRTCKTLLEKMTVSTQRRFPWRKGSIFLLLLIGAILAFDCRKHGSFEASNTGRFLKTSGINAYGVKVWSTTKAYTSKGLEYVEATSPEYYKSTVDFCKPYAKLAGDFYIVAKKFSYQIYNNTATYVDQNGPVVEATIEHYFPGMLKEIRVRSIQGLELAKVYSTSIGQQVIDNSSKGIKWLSTNVFVGKLSPESLQGYASRAIDSTQNFASQTYDWVYEKVQTLSKVP